jgi:para-nitrobenzyl esterase
VSEKNSVAAPQPPVLSYWVVPGRFLVGVYPQKGAPVFAYYFTWQSPMLEDAGAWHTAELAFCFDNTKRCEQGTGNTPQAQALAKKMANAWANFARTGNPSQPGLTWTPTDPVRCRTMVFDNTCRMVDDPEGELRRILSS